MPRIHVQEQISRVGAPASHKQLGLFSSFSFNFSPPLSPPSSPPQLPVHANESRLLLPPSLFDLSVSRLPITSSHYSPDIPSPFLSLFLLPWATKINLSRDNTAPPRILFLARFLTIRTNEFSYILPYDDDAYNNALPLSPEFYRDKM